VYATFAAVFTGIAVWVFAFEGRQAVMRHRFEFLEREAAKIQADSQKLLRQVVPPPPKTPPPAPPKR
jgi:hypothetical protein